MFSIPRTLTGVAVLLLATAAASQSATIRGGAPAHEPGNIVPTTGIHVTVHGGVPPHVPGSIVTTSEIDVTVRGGLPPHDDGTIVPTEPGMSFAMCFGDGTGTPCPMGNDGRPGHGCENSANTGGGRVWACGVNCVSHDTLRMFVDGVPFSTTVVLLQGTTGRDAGLPFGDGLNCLGGSMMRIGVQRASFGKCVFPPEPVGRPCYCSISLLGQVPAGGGMRCYQAMYRDPDAFGTRGTVNLTNAWMVGWAP